MSAGEQEDQKWMRLAIAAANKAQEIGEVPVGAVLVKDQVLLASAYNQPIKTHDCTAHAEIVALRIAGQETNNYRLPNTTMYVTLEPCMMCLGAMLHARVGRLVYAASDPKTGAVNGAMNLLSEHKHNHEIQISSGVMEEECSALLRNFFRARR